MLLKRKRFDREVKSLFTLLAMLANTRLSSATAIERYNADAPGRVYRMDPAK
jgi:hypothetical protein